MQIFAGNDRGRKPSELAERLAIVGESAPIGVTENSNNFDVTGSVIPRFFFDGMTGTFAAPSFQLTGTEDITVAQPFSFTGQVSGYLINPFVAGFTEPAFTKSLSGQGVLRATFLFNDVPETGGEFSVQSLRYDFTAAEPTPEPGTLLLCAAGLGGLAARRRRKRAATSEMPPP